MAPKENGRKKVSCANWLVKMEELVEQFPTDPEINGSNPAAVCHHKKIPEAIGQSRWNSR